MQSNSAPPAPTGLTNLASWEQQRLAILQQQQQYEILRDQALRDAATKKALFTLQQHQQLNLQPVANQQQSSLLLEELLRLQAAMNQQQQNSQGVLQALTALRGESSLGQQQQQQYRQGNLLPPASFARNNAPDLFQKSHPLMSPTKRKENDATTWDEKLPSFTKKQKLNAGDNSFCLPPLKERHEPQLQAQLISYRRIWGKLEKCKLQEEIFRRLIVQGKVPLTGKTRSVILKSKR